VNCLRRSRERGGESKLNPDAGLKTFATFTSRSSSYGGNQRCRRRGHHIFRILGVQG